MPSPGTLHGPKTDGTRRRRNKPAIDGTTIARDGRKRGPLLRTATGRNDWRPEVVQWWETWRSSAQAAAFEPTDWQRLTMLAPIVEQYWQEPQVKLLAEIRQNEERLGATFTDRLRARMKITEPADPADLVAMPAARDDVAARMRASA